MEKNMIYWLTKINNQKTNDIKKTNLISKLLKGLLWTLIVFVIFYIFISMVLIDTNIINWPEEARGVLITMVMLPYLVTFLNYYIQEHMLVDKQKFRRYIEDAYELGGEIRHIKEHNVNHIDYVIDHKYDVIAMRTTPEDISKILLEMIE